MADDFVPKLRAERDGARLREMRLATKLDDCVEILERRERQIERAREWASLKSKEARQRAGGDSYWEGCVDAYDAVVAILSEDASDANETQDSVGSA